MKERNINLAQFFNDLDKTNDAVLDYNEIEMGLKKMGIYLDDKEKK